MTMNPLPPQAYTKETLVQAYAWLQGQNEHIKELATTPDVLVSLYLKAKLQGDGALERPSIQNFKNELKNLAGMIGEFEVADSVEKLELPPPPRATTTQTFRFRSQDFKTEKTMTSGHVEKSIPSSIPHSAPQPAPHSQMHSHAQAQPTPPPQQTSAPAYHHHSPTAPTAIPTNVPSLDTRTLDMIQEVKIQFNLSSDTEAMRLLVSIGYNQVKGLLK